MARYSLRKRIGQLKKKTKRQPKIEPQEAPKPSVRDFYCCDQCHYQTKSTYSINRHLKRHKNVLQVFKCTNKVPSFKCDICSFSTKLTINFAKHLCHKTDKKLKDSMQPYCCSDCSFKTFSKLVLMKHFSDQCVGTATDDFSLGEVDLSEFTKCHQFLIQIKHLSIDWLKCQQCSYMAKIKGNLRKHMVKCVKKRGHKWSQCELCIHNVQQIFHLRHHVLGEHAYPEYRDYT